MLYLNRTLEVAAANARWQHRKRAIGLFDLRPERRPILVTVEVPRVGALDVVTAEGLRDLRLPASYPFAAGHARCRPIGRRAYKGGLPGIACRSAAECFATGWVGEELAWFDRAPGVRERGPRRAFGEWYPDSIP